MIIPEYNVYPTVEGVAQAAADALAASILAVLERKRHCHLALSGGTTPVRCLELLALKELPWSRIHCYLSDERCLPVGHAQRNDWMIEGTLWSAVGLPDENRHPIAAELGAEAAAERYAELLSRIGRLDIVVLGMGEDGHTASLFPGNAALDSTALAVPVKNSPKPPSDRVSLGLLAIQQASERYMIVTGPGKHAAMALIVQGADLPVCHIGNAHWFIDQAASCQ